MKRSLPVIRALCVGFAAAVLCTGCSLGLPGSDSDDDLVSGRRLPLPDAAPRVDPESLDVDYVEPGEEPERKRKTKKGSKAKGKDRPGRKDEPKDGATAGGGQKATKPRSAPKSSDRNPGGDEDPAEPTPRKNRKNKKSGPKDPPPVVVGDLTGDPEGEGRAPGYIDLEQVALRASGKTFVAELTFASKLPAKMPDDGHAMLASIEVDRGDEKVSVYAEADDQGWRAHTNRSADFPGSLQIVGKTMRFTLARSFFGERFQWYSHASWTKSTTTTTDYFFDFAPDDQNGRYPSGGTT